MRPTLELSQGMVLDPTTGAIPTYQVESMRSQKTVGISAVRVDVHDRSGREDPENSKLPELFVAVATALDLRVKAIGTNFEVTFTGSQMKPASAIIAERILRQKGDFVPKGMTIVGGSAKIYLRKGEHSDVTYTLSIEPRAHDPETRVIWMSCNANKVTGSLPGREELAAMLSDGCRILGEVKSALFS